MVYIAKNRPIQKVIDAVLEQAHTIKQNYDDLERRIREMEKQTGIVYYDKQAGIEIVRYINQAKQEPQLTLEEIKQASKTKLVAVDPLQKGVYRKL